MSQPTIRAHRGRAVRLTALTVFALLLSACQVDGVWGVRQSYRNYVTGPAGQGEITTAEGATWKDGDGTGKGPFTWTLDWASYDEATETGTVQLKGSVETRAHKLDATTWLMDLSIRNPRLVIDGDQGTLYADLNFRPFAGTNPDPIPALQAVTDVAFATVDLSAQDLTPQENGFRHIWDAPMVGVPSTMALIGWDAFYGTPTALDPLTVHFTDRAPALAATPSITVSATEGLKVGDQITVWGSGFDPNAHRGTRPPLAGQPSGNYVVFGKFADNWRPSQGAASSTRSVVSQRWALPLASRLLVDPSQSDSNYTIISANGTFKAVLTVGTSSAVNGNYGVYTYPGSGATNANVELAQLITLG
jgi:hypothetical protein